jgi:hypothetical protein
VHCYRCGPRLTLNVAKKTYVYFMCTARNRGECDLPYIDVAEAEMSIAEAYDEFSLDEERVGEFRKELAAYVEERDKAIHQEVKAHEVAIEAVRQEQRKLVRAHLALCYSYLAERHGLSVLAPSEPGNGPRPLPRVPGPSCPPEPPPQTHETRRPPGFPW